MVVPFIPLRRGRLLGEGDDGEQHGVVVLFSKNVVFAAAAVATAVAAVA